MATTMRDVAKAAGVSVATVSFVVNDSKPVSTDTRNRVERAMRELGYSRNMVARALSSRRTQIIALVVPFREDRMAPSLREFIVGAVRAAHEADHHLMIWPTHDPDELATLVRQHLVDGVVLMDVSMNDERVRTLRDLGAPFALIGRTRELDNLHYVDIDLDAGMRLAVEHLARLGHTRIALINGSLQLAGMQDFGPYVRFEQAYRDCMDERELESVILHCDQTAHAGRGAADELVALAPHTTAVLVADEGAAPGVVTGLASLGRSVPNDVSVMTLMSSAEVAAMCNPPLTTVAAPGLELGRLGVESVLRALNGRPPVDPPLRAGVLVLGESTRPPT